MATPYRPTRNRRRLDPINQAVVTVVAACAAWRDDDTADHQLKILFTGNFVSIAALDIAVASVNVNDVTRFSDNIVLVDCDDVVNEGSRVAVYPSALSNFGPNITPVRAVLYVEFGDPNPPA